MYFSSNLIRMLGRKELKEHTLALVDNFLEASLDASLIFEELKMDDEVEEMSESGFQRQVNSLTSLVQTCECKEGLLIK